MREATHPPDVVEASQLAARSVTQLATTVGSTNNR
jgi:hypothetical protein